MSNIDTHNDSFREIIEELQSRITTLEGNHVDIAYPQQWGAKADGVTDDTVACQNALDSGIPTIKFTGGNFLINPVDNGSYGGLKPASNTTLVFDNGVELIAKTNNSDEYSVIQLNGKNNVRIQNATIRGDRLTHTGTTGEHGHGIYIIGSDRIIIDNMKAYNCWGDGIYIGLTTNPSTNITVINSIFDGNRRMGACITSAKHVLFKNCKFLNSKGTDPQAGVDVEPNASTDSMQDIVFDSCYAYNNLRRGYVVLSHAEDVTTPISVTFKNCIADGGQYGFAIIQNKGCDGAVYIQNCSSFDAERNGFMFYHSYFPVIIDGLYVLDCGQSEEGSAKHSSGICLHSLVNDYDIGDVVARNVRIDSSDGKMLYAISFGFGGGVTGGVIKDVDIEITTNVAPAKHIYKDGDKFLGYQKIKIVEYGTDILNEDNTDLTQLTANFNALKTEHDSLLLRIKAASEVINE